jgi:hypothetical protein
MTTSKKLLLVATAVVLAALTIGGTAYANRAEDCARTCPKPAPCDCPEDCVPMPDCPGC